MLKFLPIVLLSFVSACTDVPKMLAKCSASDSDKVCGVQNPEDMDLLPSGNWLVFSEMLSEANPKNTVYGGLGALDVHSQTVVSLFGDSVANWPDADLPMLGDDNCPGKPDAAKFGGHGVDVRQLNDGTVLLAAVNHGDREAIELFSIEEQEQPIATWRGCVLLERHDIHNDVAIASDGSLYITRFSTSPHHMSVGLIKDAANLFVGGNTGYVYHWTKTDGLQLIENSEGSASNGISISNSDDVLFVAEWGTNKVYRLALDGSEVVRDEVQLEVAPDNFVWAPNGKLTVTGQEGNPFTNIRCTETTPTTCEVSYGVYEIDPNTLSVNPLHKGTGAASVAVPVEGSLYIGTFAGDNIQKHSYTN